MTTASDIRTTFFQECEELLETLFDGLAEISEDESGANPETINAIFRAVHSIKGGAAAFQLAALVDFSHRFENVLDELRSGRLAATGVVDTLQRSADHLADLVRAAQAGTEADPAPGADLSDRLARMTMREEPTWPPLGADQMGFVPLPLSFGPVGIDRKEPTRWLIRFVPGKGFLESGNDPLPILRDVGTLGEMTVEALLDRLPPLEKMDAEDLVIGWKITLETRSSLDVIEQSFEFVDGLCQLDISETVPAPELPALQDPRPPAPAVQPKRTEAEMQVPTVATRATLRVDLDHVDRLINLVGELVINQSVLARSLGDQLAPVCDLTGTLSDLQGLTREIQESVMAIRAQPVKPLFQRMARIVRDASDLAGKPVRFVTEGETTEVDKTVIEQLVDPLTHMIRNAIDHGLERPEQRRADAKPEMGVVRLTAAHRAGRIIIEVADDGAGINRPKVLEKAQSRGLIPPDAALEEAEIDNLLFLPGFSTAEAVTSLSGRGVGLDVVGGAIRKLGGRITIQSSPGRGTVMTISLPLTLAVLDGMVVQIAEETMIVPVAAIRQTLKPAPGDLQQLGASGHMVRLRDQFVPVIDLASVFGLRKTAIDPEEMVHLIIETENGSHFAFAVDAIHDQQQVVIKGMETNYGQVPCIAAATILGNGRIALIIDAEEAVKFHRPESVPVQAKGSSQCPT